MDFVIKEGSTIDKLEGLLREDSYIESEERFRNTLVYAKLKSGYK